MACTPSNPPNSQLLPRSDSAINIHREIGDLCSSPSNICLLSSSSSRNAEGGWLCPLRIAAQKGNDRIARILLQHSNIDCNERDSEDLILMIHAIMGEHEDVLRSLLLKGASTEGADQQNQKVLHWVVLKRHEAMLRILLDQCLERGALSIVETYDDLGRTPLIIAVAENWERGVQLLLEFGAEPQCKALKF